MIIRFAQPEQLTLALSSGMLPPAVLQTPVEYLHEPAGAIRVRTNLDIDAGVYRDLRQLGAAKVRGRKSDHYESASCWYQLLPLERVADLQRLGDGTPVLFELSDPAQLPILAGEMLRLGNDRQSVLHFADGTHERTLLRVIGPPYYSLLRATGSDLSAGSVRAYVACNPRVWLELGYRHRLAPQLQPAAGQFLLIRAPSQWQWLPEAPFRDIYQVIDCQLPATGVSWEPAEAAHRIAVSLRLATMGTSEPATLWVITNHPLEQLEKLVGSADDQLIHRLSFAIGEHDGSRTAVLRVRPSKQPPPVLVLDAQPFRSYLKLPNLFLPTTKRLHPPLRRDSVARLLATDSDRITWLYPQEGGQFVPGSLPDRVFRPLSDLVEYVIDHERQSLDAWVDAHRFEFDGFICEDEQSIRTQSADDPPAKPPRDPKSAKPRSSGQRGDLDPFEEQLADLEPPESETPPEAKIDTAEPESEQDRRRADVLAAIRQLEQDFLAQDGAMDSTVRGRIWRELAPLYERIDRRHDATLCWTQSIWNTDGEETQGYAAWLEAAGSGWREPQLEQRLDQLLNARHPLPEQSAALVAYLGWAAAQPVAPEAVRDRLSPLVRYLEAEEGSLPVRTAWLAWWSLHQLSGHDVLLLARARDRILESLFQQGLRAEYDLPTFLRTMGGADAERFRVVCDQLLALCPRVSDWIVEPQPVTNSQPVANPQTGAYAKLVFAYGLARMAESRHCRRLLAQANEVLSQGDFIHRWLLEAFTLRVQQALSGQAQQQRLDPALLEQLGDLERMERFKIDRLLERSNVLEPHERIDAYVNWHGGHNDPLSLQLAELANFSDREQLQRQIRQLIQANGRAAPEVKVRILARALELAPRLGETITGELQLQVEPLLAASIDVVEQAMLLEKALHVAAHYDNHDRVQELVLHFERALPEIVREYLAIPARQAGDTRDRLISLESLFAKSFRSLRKLGLREQVGRLFGRVAELLDAAQTPVASQSGTADDRVRRYTLLLSVAGGWYYFGQHERATELADQVRRVLFEEPLTLVEQKRLAAAYIGAVGQAPTEFALARIAELFEVDPGVRGTRRLGAIQDNWTTASHYSLSQLELIETVVLTLVSEEFSQSDEVRRWLDEDEFLIRSRIHRDVRRVMQGAD